MYIHFIFMEYKETKTEYLVTIKHESNDLSINEINNIIYNNFISGKESNNIGINYFSLFYIKKGLIIENETLWNELIRIFLLEIKLINLIDSVYINNLLKDNIIFFNTNIYKNNIYPLIINQYNI